MTPENLVKHLRSPCDPLFEASLRWEAADRIEELEKDRNAFLAKELEAIATWSVDGIHRYIQQLIDDQFCQKCVRGQCTGDAGGVCCDNSPVPDWSEHGFVEEKR